MTKPHCCWIDCDKPAEYDIEDESGAELPTQACTEHVGALLFDAASRVTPVEVATK